MAARTRQGGDEASMLRGGQRQPQPARPPLSISWAPISPAQPPVPRLPLPAHHPPRVSSSSSLLSPPLRPLNAPSCVPLPLRSIYPVVTAPQASPSRTSSQSSTSLRPSVRAFLSPRSSCQSRLTSLDHQTSTPRIRSQDSTPPNIDCPSIVLLLPTTILMSREPLAPIQRPQPDPLPVLPHYVNCMRASTTPNTTAFALLADNYMRTATKAAPKKTEIPTSSKRTSGSKGRPMSTAKMA